MAVSVAEPTAAEQEEVPPVLTEEAPADLRELRLRAIETMQASGESWPPPANDRLLRAARGEPVDRPPKWIMRQAGRYLPEYRAVLAKSDFFKVCGSPALAAEVTLQPFRRYPTLDSLIIFSDILVIPVAMGMDCGMVPEVGPRFDFALETPDDFARLNFSPNVNDSLAYVFDAIFWTRQRVGNEVPVIGFAGAPWTLMGYMVEGGASRSFARAKKWLYLYPEESRRLLGALRDIIVEYLVGQYDSGAPLLQVFETNCGEVPPHIYEEFCVPDLKYIADEVKRRRPNALISVFPKDGEIGVFEDSSYDVVGVSWTSSPAEARRQCPSKTLQGNLDPHVLYADPERIAENARRMVAGFGVDKYIANLGHGMMPSHPPRGPKAFIDAVDSCTKEAVAAMPVPTIAKDAGTAARLTLHMQEATSITIPFSRSAAERLQNGLTSFVAMFKSKMEAKKARRWDNFEQDLAQDDLRVEVFCNPNAYASIFDVRMFMTIRCGAQIKLASEVPLASLQSDLEAYLA